MTSIIKKISLIILITLIVFQLCFSMHTASSFSFAAETDRNKSITVYTEPSLPKAGQTVITETGVGLDTLVSPAHTSGYEITWSSSNNDIATVDSTGHVHGTLTGKYSDSDKAKCKITATVSANGQTAQDTIDVTVKRGYDINSVSVSPASLTLTTGQSSVLNVSYQSRTDVETRTEFYFISSDPEVAFVDPDGEVTAKRPGNTIITVYTLNGKYSSCKVTVTSGSAILNSYDNVETEASNDLIICYDSSVSNKKIKRSLSGYNAAYQSAVKTSESEKAVLATCTENTDIEGLLGEVENDENIIYIQPNFRYTLDADDPYYTDIDVSQPEAYGTWNQYFHFQTRINKAWELLDSNGISQTTVVGVVDSGVDADHLDLESNLILNSGKYTRFANGEKIDETDDISSNGHGTHVAGIIGAVYGNGLGGAGAASGKDNNYSRVLPVGTVTDSSGTLNSYDVIKAINYAVNNGAKVINLSFGGPYRDRLLGTAIQEHYYNNGVVFVAAAGNESTDYSKKTYDASYPSDLKEVISVCNIDRNGVKHGSTNFGYAKDISSPGVAVWSTSPDDTMSRLTGTSMSSPVVTGVCALMLDANPDLTPEQVRNILCGTAADSNGYYKVYELGYGALDAYRAVQTALDIKSGKSAPGLSISIKTPYRDKEDTISTKTTVKTTVSALKKLKAAGRKKAVKISFAKSSASMTTTKSVISTDPYTGDQTVISKSDSIKTKTSGIKYKIAFRRKGESKWKYYRVSAKTKNASKYKVSVNNKKITVTLKKLKPKARYYIKVQAYRETEDGNYYGKWSKTVSVKTKNSAK